MFFTQGDAPRCARCLPLANILRAFGANALPGEFFDLSREDGDGEGGGGFVAGRDSNRL
jgi:hypothetical protein